MLQHRKWRFCSRTLNVVNISTICKGITIDIGCFKLVLRRYEESSQYTNWENRRILTRLKRSKGSEKIFRAKNMTSSGHKERINITRILDGRSQSFPCDDRRLAPARSSHQKKSLFNFFIVVYLWLRQPQPFTRVTVASCNFKVSLGMGNYWA